MAEERLQKILARAGIASRRSAEDLIKKGRVRVDGKIVTELGTKADPRNAKVELDGKRIMPETLVYGVLHKPRGMVSTLSDPEGRPTVRDLLSKVSARVVPIGRLDFHTSGTLLFTNDGDFAAKLAHPSTGAPKVYVAKVKGSVDEKSLPRWTESIDIDGRGTKPADLRIIRDEGDKTWIQVTLREGRNRQVRRLGEHAGTPVMRLARISQAGITSEGLKPGEWRYLSVDELTTLKKQYGVPQRVRSAVASGLPKPPRPKSGAPRDPRRAPEAKASRRPSAARAERALYEGRAPRGERAQEGRAPRSERTFEGRAPRGERAQEGRSSRGARADAPAARGAGRSTAARPAAARPAAARSTGPRAAGPRASGARFEERAPRAGRAEAGRPQSPRAGAGRSQSGRSGRAEPARPRRAR